MSEIYKIKPLRWLGQIQTTGKITASTAFVEAGICKVPKKEMQDDWDRYVAYIAFDERGDELTLRFHTVADAKKWVKEKWEKRLTTCLLKIDEQGA